MIRSSVFVLALSIVACGPVSAAEYWSIDQTPQEAPDVPLEASFFGHRTQSVEASFNGGGILTLKSTEKVGHWAAGSLTIFTDRKDLGKPIRIGLADHGAEIPHIHMNFAMEGVGFPQTLMYTGVYAMYLETEVEGTTVTGRIRLSLPDCRKSYVAGRFTAELPAGD